MLFFSWDTLSHVLTSRATLLLYYLTECLLGHESKHGDLGAAFDCIGASGKEINWQFKQRQNFSPAASVHVAGFSYFNSNRLFFCFDPKGRIPGLKKRFLLFSKEPTWARGVTQALIQWVHSALFSGVKQLGRVVHVHNIELFKASTDRQLPVFSNSAFFIRMTPFCKFWSHVMWTLILAANLLSESQHFLPVANSETS
jgi:hypothetical protein